MYASSHLSRAKYENEITIVGILLLAIITVESSFNLFHLSQVIGMMINFEKLRHDM